LKNRHYVIERFLYRLAQSQHARRFVLKGALLFRAWGLPAFRPTRDIDLLGQGSNEIGNLVASVREICTQEVQADGMFFDPGPVLRSYPPQAPCPHWFCASSLPRMAYNFSKSRKLKKCPKTGVRAYARTPVFGLPFLIL